MEKQKPGVYLIHTPEPPEIPGAAQKIADMFMKQEKVSFVREIAPVLFKSFMYQALDMRLCVEASAEIERAIDIARWAGHSVKCVPQFAPGIDGTMEVCDIIYKRIGWV